MNYRSAKMLACMFTLSFVALACSFSTPASPPQEQEPAPPPETEPTVMLENPSPPASSAAAGMAVITELDPCKLVTQDIAEAALGQPVDDPIKASDTAVVSCTYLAVPGEKYATVAVYEGENAKNYLLNEIAQLQAGCELSMSTGEQPTSFSPEVEALRSQSNLELFKQDLALKEECWGGQGFVYNQLVNLGENVYSYEAFLQGAVVGVATDNAFLTFLIADVSATPEQAQAAAMDLISRATTK